MQLTVIERNGQFVVDSREVAEMTDKKHCDLLRDIRNYIETLDKSENAKLLSRNFFIPSTYTTEGNFKEYPCYLLTRKGCDMVANKMTGEKGILFTAEYVTKFEQMENTIKTQNLSPELQAIIMHDRKIQTIESKVEKLENTMTIDYGQQETLRQMANVIVVHYLGGKKTKAYKKLSTKAFSEFWNTYKVLMMVNSYKNTAVKDFDKAVSIIKTWKPSQQLALEIHSSNNELENVTIEDICDSILAKVSTVKN